MTPAKKPILVLPGQIWADTYHGSKGRTVRVVETDYRHAIVEVVTNATGAGSEGSVLMAVPYSVAELLIIARDGNGQDVLDAIEAMTATHGPGITALMLESARTALYADRFFAFAGWDEPRPAMHWTPNDEARALP